ncbi:MAG TPA: hypothetical protein VG734_05735 [Lacunisphaera sp.]|nr:hypothetical protein [Lacunisphaera sp.]
MNPTPAANETRLEFTLHARPARVWTALVKDTPTWWPQSFHTSPKTKRFVIEPKLGGMMGEITGPGEGLVWYRVIGVEKAASLLLAGYLLPPWAGPATSLLRLTLTAISADETKLELVDSTFGVVGDGAATTDGWRQIFAEHFKPHVEKGKRARARR